VDFLVHKRSADKKVRAPRRVEKIHAAKLNVKHKIRLSRLKNLLAFKRYLVKNVAL